MQTENDIKTVASLEKMFILINKNDRPTISFWVSDVLSHSGKKRKNAILAYKYSSISIVPRVLRLFSNQKLTKKFRGSGLLSRVGSEKGNPTRTVRFLKPPETARPDPREFIHFLNRPDPTREIVNSLLIAQAGRVMTREKPWNYSRSSRTGYLRITSSTNALTPAFYLQMPGIEPAGMVELGVGVHR